MLTVLHVCTDFWPSIGGIQRFVLEQARASASVGIRASVLCFNRTKGVSGVLAADEVVDGIAVKRIPFLDLKFYKPTAIRMSLIRDNDLIHVHGIGAPLDYLALTKWSHKKPIVVSTHGGIFHTETLSTLKHLYFYKCQPWVMKRVDVVVADSKSDAALFSTISNRVKLVENAVSVKTYLDLPNDRKKRGLCLYVGRLSENKGIDLLLRAVESARRHGAELNLRLVGPDVEENAGRYQNLATSLGIADRVMFVGSVDDQALLQEYAFAETFVSASRHEGFGLSAMEAKAAGCRLLLNDNEAFRSLFKADAAATLVDFENSGLAGTVWAALMQEEPDLAIQETRRDAAAYSWDRKMSEWSSIYRSLGKPRP